MREIKLIVCDVDGVLTSGEIIYDNQGNELKKFNVKDGFGIKAAQLTGVKVGVITARESEVVHKRVAELGMGDYYHYGVHDKAVAVQKLAEAAGCELEEVAYVGDDVIDMSAMKLVGYPIAVADAVQEVKDLSKHVMINKGGEGAVREAIEMILKTQGTWHRVIETYGGARKSV
ncbi:3-deoxy-D-manno-octulosonate 8-phosphate phosphatase KdsC [Poriferisphaera corsica]|uniref:3-deoxy-D-manno-octulosonate 8-phosphate phosphatase KdsC n=1 Tax=Poriferisphaera corsica TaxID=2528020 RepID=A0A517YR91_9BACT|nr:HAD hydrolase family protein [Poriferisphaera corsica]QDU32739.1 3-deoxy-D-manno-octulosonate 8-phosphate phosphatase KdsC [Poriferisphaera corsica]